MPSPLPHPKLCLTNPLEPAQIYLLREGILVALNLRCACVNVTTLSRLKVRSYKLTSIQHPSKYYKWVQQWVGDHRWDINRGRCFYIQVCSNFRFRPGYPDLAIFKKRQRAVFYVNLMYLLATIRFYHMKVTFVDQKQLNNFILYGRYWVMALNISLGPVNTALYRKRVFANAIKLRILRQEIILYYLSEP